MAFFGTAIAVAVGAIAVGSVAQAVIGADAARKAGKAQAKGAQQAVYNEEDAFKDYQTRADAARDQSTNLFNQSRDQGLNLQQNALNASQAALLDARNNSVGVQQNALNDTRGVLGTVRDQNIAAQQQAFNNIQGNLTDTRNQNNATQANVYNTNAAIQQPFYQTGVDANAKMASYLGLGGNSADPNYGKFTQGFTNNDFQQDPGYGFRFQEGLKALERSAAAKGNLLGGAQVKASQRYGQDFASNEYQNAYNRFNQDRQFTAGQLSGAINNGMSAGNQIAGYGTNYANATNANNQNYSTGMTNANNNLANSVGSAYQNYGTGMTNANQNYANSAMNAYQNYGTGLTNANTGYANQASNIYQNAANNQSNMLNTYAQNYGSQRSNSAANISNIILAGAKAKAQGYIGQANAYNAGIGGITDMAGQFLGAKLGTNKLV